MPGIITNLNGSFTYIDSASCAVPTINKSQHQFDRGREECSATVGNKITAKWKRKLENRKKRKETAVIDSAATSSFWQLVDDHIKTGEASNKQVAMPTGHTAATSEKALIPNKNLNEKARQCDLLPELQDNSLVSVCKLADAGYTTVFHAGEGGVTVHWHKDVYVQVKKPAILQGWRDEESGLWRVPIKEEVKTTTQTHFSFSAHAKRKQS